MFPWFGEGDDFFWIDGEEKPSLMGTGTEDYFCQTWGYPGGFNSMPYHGISYPVNPSEGPTRYSGKWTMFRFSRCPAAQTPEGAVRRVLGGCVESCRTYRSEFQSRNQDSEWLSSAAHVPVRPMESLQQ